MTETLLLPVSEFFNILVNFDERYGINLSESFIANSDITLPSAESELLINLAYFNLKSLNISPITLSSSFLLVKSLPNQ